MKEKIGVIGLGYVGLPLLAVLADVGFKVIGIDINKNKINQLKHSFAADIYEPDLNEHLQRLRDRIEFTTSLKELLPQCSTLIVTVGTPLRDKNKPDIGCIKQLVTDLGENIIQGQLIIFKSTVYPGITRQVALELEKKSGLKAGLDFHVAFSPERTVEGRAITELRSLPKIIGGISPESTERAAAVLGRLGGKVIKVSCPEVAEMCKLVDNSYRAVNIAFANEIGFVCEKGGIDAYEVISAVNDGYQRNHIFKPSLGAGGPCLSKDPQILKYYMKKEGGTSNIIGSSIITNDEANLRIAWAVSRFVKENKLANPVISLVGLAFKGSPETDDTRESPSLQVYNALRKDLDKTVFQFYDPLVKEFNGQTVCRDLGECCRGSNVIIFLTNHPTLMDINVNVALAVAGRPLLMIDCWHNLANPERIKMDDVKVFRVGDGTL